MLKSLNLLKFNKWVALFSSVISLCAIEAVFTFVARDIAEQRAVLVESFLNDQKVVSNPYSVALRIEDLEKQGQLACTKFRSTNDDSNFIDLSFKTDCDHSAPFFDHLLFMNFSRINKTLSSNDGRSWLLEARSVHSGYFQLALWFSRFGLLLFIGITYFYSKIVIDLAQKQNESEAHHAKAIFNIASQVAHDIRSPLSALEMVSSQLIELSEEKRTIIRNSLSRIRDIANSLSVRTHTNEPTNYEKTEELKGHSEKKRTESTLLLPVLDMIVTEKRIENRDQLNLKINFDQTQTSYGLFSNVEIHNFKRALSNLINNAIESLPDSKGKVDIYLEEHGKDLIRISIKDTGIGISKDLISKLAIRGNTFNKEGGSGLGLAHAKEVLASFGGSLEIQSEENFGTTVSIFLPKQSAPDWFIPKLIVTAQTKIIILDDDQSIHEIWKEKFDSLNISKSHIDLFHFSNPNEFRKYFGKNFDELGDALFLMDYEILNHKETGLDLIEELGIRSQSILVTSRYEEPIVRDRCEKMGVKLIPKSMSGFVPIEVEQP